MKKRNKILLGIGIGLLLVSGIVLVLNNYLEAEIKSAIENQLSDSQIEYESVSVSVLNRSSAVSTPRLQLDNITLEADFLEVKRLSYTDYFLHSKIVIDVIEITDPEVVVYPKDTSSVEKEKSAKTNLGQNVVIKNIHIKGGALRMLARDSVQNNVFLALRTFDLYDVQISDSTLESFLPFKYERMEVSSDSLFYAMDDAHDLAIKDLKIKDGDITLKNLRIIPKFSKVEFDQRLSREKDRFELQVETVDISDLSWDFKQDSLQLTSPFVQIDQADFNVYRNKTLPDDTTIKPLYSRMVREMGVKIKFDSIRVRNSRIGYEEKTDTTRPPGVLDFSEVQVSIENLTNIGMNSPDFPKTAINIKAMLMEISPLHLNWTFDVRDASDDFTVSGGMDGISADAMNAFLRPTMNIEVQGRVQSLFYNFRGDHNQASGDMRMEYQDFKVEVLKKDGSKKNNFLTDLANIIIRENDNNEKLERKNIQVERDKTKSFWNYLWLFIRKGTLKSFL